MSHLALALRASDQSRNGLRYHDPTFDVNRRSPNKGWTSTLQAFKPPAVIHLLVSKMGKGGHSKGGGHHPSPNDQRSNSLNPNNPASAASQVNRGVQLNPNNPEYKGPATKVSAESEDSDD
jgi:hypothetical protein